MNIVTTYDPPPIPTRHADWSAVDQDTYDPENGIIGRGISERAAINDLVTQLVQEAFEDGTSYEEQRTIKI